jgi:hypothetical protein
MEYFINKVVKCGKLWERILYIYTIKQGNVKLNRRI